MQQKAQLKQLWGGVMSRRATRLRFACSDTARKTTHLAFGKLDGRLERRIRRARQYLPRGKFPSATEQFQNAMRRWLANVEFDHQTQ
jgi:hypothetical protein